MTEMSQGAGCRAPPRSLGYEHPKALLCSWYKSHFGHCSKRVLVPKYSWKELNEKKNILWVSVLEVFARGWQMGFFLDHGEVDHCGWRVQKAELLPSWYPRNQTRQSPHLSIITCDWIDQLRPKAVPHNLRESVSYPNENRREDVEVEAWCLSRSQKMRWFKDLSESLSTVESFPDVGHWSWCP